MKSTLLDKSLLSVACVSTAVVVLAAVVVGVRDILPGMKPAIGNTTDQKNLLADGTPETQPGVDANQNQASPTPAVDDENSHKPMPTDEETLSEPGANTKAKTTSEPVDKSNQPAYLQIQSEPAGARVEVGLQYTGSRITPGTGRQTCVAPCVIKLDPADVAVTPKGEAKLIISLEKNQYARHFDVMDLGSVDRSEALTPGKTYTRNITLQPETWLQKDAQQKQSTWNFDSQSKLSTWDGDS